MLIINSIGTCFCITKNKWVYVEAGLNFNSYSCRWANELMWFWLKTTKTRAWFEFKGQYLSFPFTLSLSLTYAFRPSDKHLKFSSLKSTGQMNCLFVHFMVKLEHVMGNKSLLRHAHKTPFPYTLQLCCHALCCVLKRDTRHENLNTLHSYL